MSSLAVDDSTSLADSAKGSIYVPANEFGVVDRFQFNTQANLYQYESQLTASEVPVEPWSPLAVAVDPLTGNLLVSDYLNNDVDVFDSEGKYKTQFNGAGTPAGSFETLLGGVAVDPSSGAVWVADTGEAAAGHNVIDQFKFNATSSKYEYGGVHLTASEITGGSGSWNLGTRSDLAVDDSGNVYVFDSENDMVDIFNAAGAYQDQIPVSSEADSMAVDPISGDVYVGLYSAVIAEYSPSGSLITQFGSGTTETAGLAVTADSEHTRVYATGGVAVQIFEELLKATPTTGSATELQATSVTVRGTVNPEGFAATSLFEFGAGPCPPTTPCTPTAYSSTMATSPNDGADGEGTNPVGVEAHLTGLVPNSLYHYQLSASDSNGAEPGGENTFTTPALAPVLTNAPVSGTSIVPAPGSGIARFTGTVNPEHADTHYHFEYGTTEAYGTSTPVTDVGAGYGDQTVSQTVEGLAPDTVYDLALVAENEFGMKSTSPNATFTTLATAPPQAITGSAQGVTQEAATLTGEVNPQGLPTTYEFQLGSDTSYGTNVSGDAGSISEATSVTLALSDLASGSTYHYRLVAFNSAGTSYGVDQTFTTPAFPSPLAQPLTPALIPTPTITPPTKESPEVTQKKPLTRAQQRAKALNACKRDKSKQKRTRCERQAKKKYRPAHKTTAKKKKSTNSDRSRK